MPQKLIDLTGKRFGMLVVRNKAGKEMFGGKLRWYWNVVCDCGQHNQTAGDSLRNGRTKSCGCMQHARNH